MTTATGKTTVRQDALAQIAKAVKDGSADRSREGLEFGNNRRQRTETGAGAVVTECNCPAGKCQPESNIGTVCWRSGFDIRASDFTHAVSGDHT